MTELISDKWLSLADDVFAPAAVIVICTLIYLAARRALRLLESRNALAPPVIALLRMLLRWTFSLLFLFLLLNAIGILENVWAAFLAIFAMIAVGFIAVWSVLSNTFCTLLLLIYKPFQIGDHIIIPADGLEGEVTDLNLMFTTLTGNDRETIQIPNNQFFQKAVRRVPGEKQRDLYEQLRKSGPSAL